MSAVDPRAIAIAFGAALKVARTEARLSQEALAERAGLDRTTPSLYERGLRQPTVAGLIILGQALECDPSVLVRMTVDRLRESSQ
jgi:transcriptional regulator with XRE-family HTH domain